jgi:hypothetical protein
MDDCDHARRWIYKGDGLWTCGDCGEPCDAPPLGLDGEELRTELLRHREADCAE